MVASEEVKTAIENVSATSVGVRAFVDEVRPQVYAGQLNNDGHIVGGRSIDMVHEQDLGEGRHRFRVEVNPVTSGRHGFALRVVPGGALFDGVSVPGLIRWEQVDPVEEPAEEPAPAAKSA